MRRPRGGFGATGGEPAPSSTRTRTELTSFVACMKKHGRDASPAPTLKRDRQAWFRQRQARRPHIQSGLRAMQGILTYLNHRGTARRRNKADDGSDRSCRSLVEQLPPATRSSRPPFPDECCPTVTPVGPHRVSGATPTRRRRAVGESSDPAQGVPSTGGGRRAAPLAPDPELRA